MRRGLVITGLFLLSLAVGFAVWPGSAQHSAHAAGCGTTQRNYRFQRTTPAAYGVDGYILYPSGSLVAPSCDTDADWIGVDGPGVQFAAIGATAGLTSYGPWSSYHAYSDGYNACLVYHLEDYGSPPAPNTAYYVHVDSLNSFTGCGINYLFDYKVGDFYNAPVGYRALSVSNGTFEADREVIKTSGTWPNPGTSYYGHQTTTTYPLAFGLSWYDYPGGQSWHEWNASVITSVLSSTYPGGTSQNYTYCSDVSYRAFHVVKNGTAC